jgi:Fic family protein
MAARSAGVDAELAWLLVKMSRMQRYRMLPLLGGNGEQLRFNVPNQVQHELMLIDQQTAGRLLSDEKVPLSHDQSERFVLSALHEEAIASSMLEGAATTRRDAKNLLRMGRKPKTRGERMVVNNYQAIAFTREFRNTPLSADFLLELHRILTKDTLDRADDVGRFRTERDDVNVVDTRDNAVMHTPPPAREMEERMERICQFANQSTVKRGFVHPVIRACVLHFQLGFDHPFCDGNGRTARAIFYWSLLRQGYWLFEYLPISRLIYRGPSKYVHAFLYSETDEFDITYFLMYKTKIIRRARKELHDYIGDKQAQLLEARKLLGRDPRLNHRQQQVVLVATRNPDVLFTIADHQNRFAVSYGTARNDLRELAQWGYLNHSTDQKRHEFHPSENLRKEFQPR